MLHWQKPKVPPAWRSGSGGSTYQKPVGEPVGDTMPAPQDEKEEFLWSPEFLEVTFFIITPLRINLGLLHIERNDEKIQKAAIC